MLEKDHNYDYFLSSYLASNKNGEVTKENKSTSMLFSNVMSNRSSADEMSQDEDDIEADNFSTNKSKLWIRNS